jgi:hypothetical protein
MGGLHRRYQRGKVAGYSCDITDGQRFFGGVVEDISSNGFKMSHLSDSFLADEHSYLGVISGNGKHFKILAKPCWRRQTPSGLEIGFKIVDVSWEWTEFILEKVPGKILQSGIQGNA